MDSARAAAQSWPDANPRFIWPPPEKRERPAPGGTGSEAQTQITDVITNTIAARAAQRATQIALARAARLDRDADALLNAGLHLQAEVLAHRATAMREVAQ